MFTLRIDPTWARQIAAIRDANSDDSNLIRFDNGFYRVCRAAPAQIHVQLVPSSGGAAEAIDVLMGTQDFYVALIAGQPFGRYASTIDGLQVDAATLDNAIREIRGATGTRRFELQSMLVFCLAESIRSDLIATQIESTIRASLGRLLGAPVRLPIASMLLQARAWGQSSDAVWAALSPSARAIYAKAPAMRTPEERRFSERINENAVDPALRSAARGVKVLKRPGV